MKSKIQILFLPLCLLFATSLLLTNCDPAPSAPLSHGLIPIYTSAATATATPTTTGTANATTTVTLTPTLTPCTGVFGNNTTAGNTAVSSTDAYWSLYQASATTTVMSLSIYMLATGGQYELAVYSDNGGHTSPDGFIAGTGVQSVSTAGWNTANLTPSVLLISGTYYWLAFHTSGSFNIQTSGLTAALQNVGSSFPGLPSLFSGTTTTESSAFFGTTCP